MKITKFRLSDGKAMLASALQSGRNFDRRSKRYLLTLALAFTGVLASWAQDEVTLTPTATANEWTLQMPDADVELEVTYYTDEELSAEQEAAYTAGVELTKAANGEWTLAEMPSFDIELEVEYETALALNEVDDNTATLAEWNGYEADVTLTRTLQAGGWNTLAVPFNVSTATIAIINASLAPNSMVIKKLASTSLQNGTLTLNFEDANEIEAGKPYLVKVPSEFKFATTPFAGIIMSNAVVPFTSDYVDFVPTLGKTLVTGPAGNESNTNAVLFLATGNKLKNPTVVNNASDESSYMKGFRAYFQLKGDAISTARSFSLNLGDEVTGIQTTDFSDYTDGVTYDLQGRRVSGTAQKGVYIVNGKKVIIK
jgi:hypothetical protein